MWGIIATWRMALEGVTESASALAAGKPVAPAVVDAVAAVEDFPFYKSVGYGGLPTENGEVELDAAYMDGDTLAFGAVGNLVDIANPVRVAHALSRQRYNSLLVGGRARMGAERALPTKPCSRIAPCNTTVSAAAKRWIRG